MRPAALLVTVLLAGCRLGFGDVADGDAGTGSGDGGATSDTPPRPNVAFITSTMHNADFGGIAAADAECRARATAQGLPGTFIALLGDSTQGPLDRLTGSRGWVDTIGRPIVDEATGWLDGSMWHPLMYDESGTAVPYDILWMGTLNDRTCVDWTDAAAPESSIVTTRTVFGGFSVNNCQGTARLICAEIGNDVVLTHPTTAGRRLFKTDNPWSSGGGRASADAFCASEASAAGLAGTFLALLGTSTEGPWDRFSTQGPTWIRLDGIALAPTAIAVATATPPEIDSFAIVTASGGHYPYATQWFGSPAASCSDWNATNAGTTGTFGAAEYVQKTVWLSLATAGCDAAFPITCVEP